MLQNQAFFRMRKAKVRFYSYGSTRCRDLGSRNIHTVAGIMLDADMVFRNKHQRYIPINASEEGKIGSYRRDSFIVGIVHLYPEAVVPGVDAIADIKDKSRIAPLVVPSVGAVYVKVHNLVGSFKANENFLTGKVVINLYCFLIPSRPPVVAGDIVNGVLRIPSMRKGHGLFDRVTLFPESPAIIYAPLISWCSRYRLAHKT